MIRAARCCPSATAARSGDPVAGAPAARRGTGTATGDNGPMAQVALPLPISQAGQEETQERIADARARLGKRLVILGHHYQRDEVIRHADFTGDSLQAGPAARPTGRRPSSSSSAASTSWPSRRTSCPADHQTVILPDLNAGCTMADMADIDQVEDGLGATSPRRSATTSCPSPT